MVIKADLKCKQTDFNLPLCQIEKVVKLTPSEYTEFVSNPLDTMIFSESLTPRSMSIYPTVYRACCS